MFIGAILSEICFDITYVYTVFGGDLENIPNRVFYGLHLLGLALAIMGMFDMVKMVKKQGGYKPRVQIEILYFRAFKREIVKVLKKVKAIIV